MGGWRVEDKHREREQRDGGVGSVLFSLVFLSRSDAGVCRHAWRRSRRGLQHEDHYREHKKKRETTEGERVKATDSEVSGTFCVCTQRSSHFSCSHDQIAAFVTKTSGFIAKLPSDIQPTVKAERESRRLEVGAGISWNSGEREKMGGTPFFSPFLFFTRDVQVKRQDKQRSLMTHIIGPSSPNRVVV